MIQYSVRVRDAQNDAMESAIGASPSLELRTGAQPANCAAADTGTLLCAIALPADWLTAAMKMREALLAASIATQMRAELAQMDEEDVELLLLLA